MSSYLIVRKAGMVELSPSIDGSSKPIEARAKQKVQEMRMSLFGFFDSSKEEEETSKIEEANSGARNALQEAGELMHERGEKLSRIEMATNRLKDSSENFASAATRLRKSQEKGWFPF